MPSPSPTLAFSATWRARTTPRSRILPRLRPKNDTTTPTNPPINDPTPAVTPPSNDKIAPVSPLIDDKIKPINPKIEIQKENVPLTLT
jgi:hypothetical protein